MDFLNDRAQQTQADVFMTDADLALTFLDLAETTVVEEDRLRRRAEARRAYYAILTFVSKSRRPLPNPQKKVLRGLSYGIAIAPFPYRQATECSGPLR